MHQLRLLIEEDAAELWRFRLAALEQAPESFAESADELRSSPVEETVLRLRASSGENFVLGAFVDRRLAATVGFFRNRGIKTKHKGRVWGLYVDPALRRHGIARSMMHDLLLRIRGVEGLCQVSLSVATTQIAAIGLYKSVGFTPFGLEPRALRIGDEFLDEEHHVLVLDLSAERMAD